MTVERGNGWELRLGRWQDVLRDVECDSLITDPPYSERTHSGQRSSDSKRISKIHYAPMTGDVIPSLDVRWVVVFSDHTGAARHEAEMLARGLYVFAPVIWVKPGAPPRLAGDGPCSAAEYITVARPRRRVSDAGSRPGLYTFPPDRSVAFMGSKPLGLMRALVRDYSRPGDLVCDPYAGTGTTLLAAVAEGRRAIGAECDPETFRIAVDRLRNVKRDGSGAVQEVLIA